MAGLAACLLLALVGLWAAGVFKLKTKDGTIVLENLPADAEVFVDGETGSYSNCRAMASHRDPAAPANKLEIKAAGFKMETRGMNPSRRRTATAASAWSRSPPRRCSPHHQQ